MPLLKIDECDQLSVNVGPGLLLFSATLGPLPCSDSNEKKILSGTRSYTGPLLEKLNQLEDSEEETNCICLF